MVSEWVRAGERKYIFEMGMWVDSTSITWPWVSLLAMDFRWPRIGVTYEGWIQGLVFNALELIAPQSSAIDEAFCVWELSHHGWKGVDDLTTDLDTSLQALSLQPWQITRDINDESVDFEPEV